MELLNYTIFSEDGTISFKKPILVCIHGLAVGNANWLHQVRYLKSRYDLLLIELPSHGKSKIMLSDLEPDFNSISPKVAEVLEHLGIEKATFIGVSLGTLTVQHFVLNYPEKVLKHILISPIGEFTWLLRAALKLVSFLLSFAPLKVVLKVGSLIIMPYKNLAYGRNLFVRCAERMERKELLAWCKTILSFKKTQDIYGRIMKDEPDGLYIIGELDYFFQALLKDDIKRVKNLAMVANAGHICNIDQHEQVNKLIVSFMETGKAENTLLHTLPSK